MTLDLGFTLFILIFISSLGLLVYFNNRRSKTNKSFGVLTFWMVVWISSNFLENATQDLNLASLFLKIDFASAAILSYFWLNFCINFPEQHQPFSLTKKALLVLPSILFVFLSFSDLIISNIRIDNRILFDSGILFFFYVIYIVAYMIVGGCGYLILKYSRSKYIQRTQILYVLLGLLISGSVAAVINLFLQQVLPLELFRIGTYVVIFIPSFAAYAIVKKNLFGIRVILTSLFVGLIAMLLLLDVLLFTDNLSFQIFKGAILVLFIIFGFSLVRSVINEIKQKEKIEKMAEEIARAYEVEKKANEELKELGNIKNQFLMTIQHHLRTPLTSMRGYSDLLLDGSFGKLPEKVREVVERFEVSTSSLIKMVNDFLDVTQFQLGKQVISLKDGINLSPMLEEIVGDIKLEAEKKGLFLKLEKPAGDCLIRADESKLKAALVNVFDNAVKYTKEGGVAMTLKSNPKKVIIEIKDTGMGIPKDRLAKLFDSTFERTEESKKAFTMGRGVGLYLAGQIIKAHNGKVWAESEGEGKGSKFIIELPVK